jgi:hypothetical protein
MCLRNSASGFFYGSESVADLSQRIAPQGDVPPLCPEKGVEQIGDEFNFDGALRQLKRPILKARFPCQKLAARKTKTIELRLTGLFSGSDVIYISGILKKNSGGEAQKPLIESMDNCELYAAKKAYSGSTVVRHRDDSG